MWLWIKKFWIKVRSWFYAILLALGFTVPILAAMRDFSYDPATTYTDGTPLPADQIAETRLYCNADPAPLAAEPGADGNFAGIVFTPGDYVCHSTHVATNGLESAPSNEVTFTVLPEVAPSPPENFTVN